jgi:hypothetical protein
MSNILEALDSENSNILELEIQNSWNCWRMGMFLLPQWKAEFARLSDEFILGF